MPPLWTKKFTCYVKKSFTFDSDCYNMVSRTQKIWCNAFIFSRVSFRNVYYFQGFMKIIQKSSVGRKLTAFFNPANKWRRSDEKQTKQQQLRLKWLAEEAQYSNSHVLTEFCANRIPFKFPQWALGCYGQIGNQQILQIQPKIIRNLKKKKTNSFLVDGQWKKEVEISRICTFRISLL